MPSPEAQGPSSPMNLPTPFHEPAADGYILGGFTWRHPRTDLERPVVIINAATSVRCRHYARFAFTCERQTIRAHSQCVRSRRRRGVAQYARYGAVYGRGAGA